MASESSFDIVSQVDRMEIRNAIQQATKEVRTRFDFKGSTAAIEETGDDLVLSAEDEGRLKALRQILEEIRAGKFTEALSDEEASGYPRLRAARDKSRKLRVESARRRLLG